MVHRKNMKTIDAGLPAREIAEQAMESSHTRIPLWRDEPENIVGVLHARDLLRAVAAEGVENVDAASLMRPPWFTTDQTRADNQLADFLRRRGAFRDCRGRVRRADGPGYA